MLFDLGEKYHRLPLCSNSCGPLTASAASACGQVANPDALTILIDGDGSFGMTNMDLQTVKRWGNAF